MLLILTSDQDLTADYLIVELLRRQLPYFRLNAEELSQADFTFSLSGAGTTRSISVGPKTLDLNTVEAVWYRRSIHPIPKTVLAPAERYFVSGELRHLVMGLVLNPQIVWVNPIDKVSVAEHKLYQLQVAVNLGFRVPRTFVSGDVDKLRSFASGNPAGTICKPIFHGMFFDGMSRHSVYTRRLDVETLDTASVNACPVLLQEEIPRVGDVRATFIGRHCFVADIRGDASLVDWRDPDVSVDYAVSSLDDTTTELCRHMLAELGLVYGAFDFVRTPSGDLVFLEVNPTGEWAWLEDKLGFLMREAFVESFFGDRN
jgi:glutathione synthase/RimK-type ligase-like ATP-grasp enzyme